MKVRKKPVVVEAVQWNKTNVVEVYNFLEDENVQAQFEVKAEGKNFYIKFENGPCQLGTLMIKTLEGEHKASVGDYIIKGVNGEFYPCKPDIFEKTYDVVKEERFLHNLSKEELIAHAERMQKLYQEQKERADRLDKGLDKVMNFIDYHATLEFACPYEIDVKEYMINWPKCSKCGTLVGQEHDCWKEWCLKNE